MLSKKVLRTGPFELGKDRHFGDVPFLAPGLSYGCYVRRGGANALRSAPLDLAVNSAKKVTNLNADKVDGKEASQLIGARAYARVSPGPGFGAKSQLGPK